MPRPPVLYLDYNATTPVDDRVLQKMLPFFSSVWGNPSSRDHSMGWEAEAAVEDARDQVADFIGAKAAEITFTASATESINCALRGLRVCEARTRAIAGATEHEAVLETCRLLASKGTLSFDILGVDRAGTIAGEAVAGGCAGGRTAFVSVMLANHEVGTIHPVRTCADAAHAAGAVMFSDLSQAAGRIPVHVEALGVDLAAFSAHKMYGPKGVGALYIRETDPRLDIAPLVVGGGHERRLRAGTLNVPGIVGFGEACRIAKLEMDEERQRVEPMRDRLEEALLAQLSDVWINGNTANRLVNTSSLGFRGVHARALIRDLHDVAVSTRSACASGEAAPSHVLKAIGLSDEDAYSCVRFSLGRFTTGAEIDYAIEKVVTSVHKLRRLKSLRD